MGCRISADGINLWILAMPTMEVRFVGAAERQLEMRETLRPGHKVQEASWRS